MAQAQEGIKEQALAFKHYVERHKGVERAKASRWKAGEKANSSLDAKKKGEGVVFIQMGLHVIEHERFKCIGCGSCAAVKPEFWEMSQHDGKADLKDCKKLEGEIERRNVSAKDAEENRLAETVCPVNCIHVTGEGK